MRYRKQQADGGRRKRAIGSVIAGGALVAAIVAGCGAARQPNNAANGQASTTTSSTTAAKPLANSAVIATYTGGSVTKGQFDAMYNTIGFLAPLIQPGSQSPTKAQFVNQYVAYFCYLLGQAEKDGAVKKTATSQVNQNFPQFLQQLTQQFSTKAKLDAQLKTAGTTEADLKAYMYDDALLGAYLQKSLAYIKVTPAEVNAYLKQNQLKYTQVDAAHILVKSLKTANLVEQKLKAGGNFAALAKQYSIDGSKNNGGDLGPATLDSYVTPFANACLTLPLNTVSKPVQSRFGYHIIKVLSRQVLTSKAKSDLLSQKQQAAEGPLLSKIEKQAKVKVVVKPDQL